MARQDQDPVRHLMEYLILIHGSADPDRSEIFKDPENYCKKYFKICDIKTYSFTATLI
jgi:hypothetical protein